MNKLTCIINMCREKQLAPAYIDDDGWEASSCSCNCKPCTRPCRAADEALTVDCSSGNQGHIFECSFHTCSSLGNCVIRKWQNTRLDFVSIPDGVDPQDGREERIQLSESMQRVMPSHLENLIMKINSSEDDQMATCFIAHATIAWALDTAKKMGVKMAMFWPSAVAAFALSLIDAKITDHNGEC